MGWIRYSSAQIVCQWHFYLRCPFKMRHANSNSLVTAHHMTTHHLAVSMPVHRLVCQFKIGFNIVVMHLSMRIARNTMGTRGGGTLNTPPRTFRGVRSRLGQPPGQKIWTFRTRPKTAARPPDFKKTIALAFLKATYSQIPY